MLPYIQIMIPTYALMAVLGGTAAALIIFFRLEKYQIQFTEFMKMFIFCILGGYAGSKVLFAMTQIPWLIENFSLTNLIFLIPKSGLVFYGGLFGVIFMLLFLTRKDLELRSRVFKMVVPAMPLFHVFGRIGCFLSGCCYGKEIEGGLIIGFFEFHRIPIQLIEAFCEFIIFIIVLTVRKKKPDTNLLRVYLVIYAIVRFTDEFFRGDLIRGIYFGLSTAQWISLIILTVYFVKAVKAKKQSSIQKEQLHQAKTQCM